MNRLFWLTSAATLLLAVLLSIGAAAQDSQSKRVTPGRRIPVSSFELEVLVDGRPLTESHERGRTYVEARAGAEYELRLRNASPDRVAVALSVDGLNTIDARQTSAWNSSKWVIEPHETITIEGWQMSSERARRFYFTTARDSYAAKLGQTTANVGVISAVFFRERRRAMPITQSAPEASAAEPRLKADMSRDSRAATGIGRSIRNDVRLIDMELDPRPAAELTMRYDYSKYEYSRGRFCPEPALLQK